MTETALARAAIQRTATALYVVGELSFQEFCDQLAAIEAAEHAVPYWLGDLMNYGLTRWDDQAWQAAGIDVQRTTGYTYAWVCRRFPPGDPARELGLSLSTLRLVAPLCYEHPKLAQEILRDHADNKFSRKELKLRLQLERARLRELPAGPTDPDSQEPVPGQSLDDKPIIWIERPHRTRPGICHTCSCVLEGTPRDDEADPQL